MNEKCFCHIECNGETYVVKDKEARENIAELEERVDAMDGGASASIEDVFHGELDNYGIVFNSEHNRGVIADYMNKVKEKGYFFPLILNYQEKYYTFTPNNNYLEINRGAYSFSYLTKDTINGSTLYNAINKITLSFNGSFVNDSFNCTQATMSEQNITFLEKDNIRSYTPSHDYNPATKKYVDDSVKNISSINVVLVDEIPTTGLTAKTFYYTQNTQVSEVDGSVYDMPNELAYSPDGVNIHTISNDMTAQVHTNNAYNHLSERFAFATYVDVEFTELGLKRAAYPEGFNAENCYIESIMYKPSGGSFKTDIGGTTTNVQVGLGDEDIVVNNSLSSTCTVRIVLNKYLR